MAVLEHAGVAPVVATLPPGFAGRVRADVHSVSLPAEARAMLDSLRVALDLGLGLGVWQVAVIHPVDHPLVLAPTIRALVTALSDPGPRAALPRCRGKHGHPVAVTREVCEKLVQSREPWLTLRDVLHSVVCVDVAVDDPGVLANCNTPERLAEALRAIEPSG